MDYDGLLKQGNSGTQHTNFEMMPSRDVSVNKGSMTAGSIAGESTGMPKSCWQRYCGKITQGSIRGHLFTLWASSMGASSLTMPFIFMECGLIIGIAIVLGGALINLVSYRILVDATSRFKIYNYGKLAKVLIGKRTYKLVEVWILLYSIGIVIGFQIISGQLIVSLFQTFEIPIPGNIARPILMWILNWALMLPLASLRDLSSLRFFAAVSPVALTFIAVVSLIEFPFYNEATATSDIDYAHIDLNIFSCIVIPLVAYCSHTNVVSVLGAISDPNKVRMKKLTDRCVTIVVIVYLILGIFGYLSTLHDTPSVFTSREGPSQVQPDIPIIIGRFLMLLGLVFSVPVNVSPARAAILTFLKKKVNTPLWLHMLITILLLEITLGIAIAVPNVTFVFSIMGGICPIFLVIIYPGMIYLRIHEDVPKWQRQIFTFWVVVLSCVGFATVVVTILQEAGMS